MGVDLMKFDEIQEEIQRYSKAAGAGNFERTVFERSLNEVVCSSFTSMNYNFAKLIPPETGMYKVVYDYTLTLENIGSSDYSEGFNCFKFIGYRTNSSNDGTMKKVLNSYDYFSISLGYGRPYVSYDLYENLPWALGISSSLKHIEKYIHLSKGVPIVLQYTLSLRAYGGTATFTMKNLKITY